MAAGQHSLTTSWLFPRSSTLTRRVVITGLGLVTPVGNTVEDTWTALMNSRSGADYIKKFDAERFSVKFDCEVKNLDPLTFIAKKEARKMGAFIHYAIAASIEAVADSGSKFFTSQANLTEN